MDGGRTSMVKSKLGVVKGLVLCKQGVGQRAHLTEPCTQTADYLNLISNLFLILFLHEPDQLERKRRMLLSVFTE